MFEDIQRGGLIPPEVLATYSAAQPQWLQGHNPLTFAAACGNLNALEQLLALGLSPNAPDQLLRLPLEVTAGNGHAAATQALLNHGANPQLAASDGRPIIHHAVDSGDADTVRALAQAGGDPVLLAPDERGHGPLDRAVQASLPEVVAALCTAGAAARYRIPDVDEPPEPPGIAAARIGDPAVLAVLHETGALALPGMALTFRGETPLHAAAGAGHNAATAYLLSIGMPSDATDAAWRTPLHHAAAAGHLEPMQTLLLQGGADPNAMNGNGTPLHAAVLGGHTPAARLLLRYHANPHAANMHGTTALHMAAAQHPRYPAGTTVALLQTLIAGGADPEQKDHQGRTAADLLQAGGADPAIVAAARAPAPPAHHAPEAAAGGAVAGDAHAGGPPAPAPHYTAVMAAAARPPTPVHGM